MIIVDTNVIVSGLITNNPAAPTVRIVDAIVAGRIRPIMSPALLDEYRAVLLRPKIKTLHGLGAEQLDDLLGSIVQHSIWREPNASGQDAPDVGDNHLWDLLHAESTATLVTGDLRLLDTPPFETRVIRVQDYDADHH